MMLLNSLLYGNRISMKYSPREIVPGRQMKFKEHCKVLFGSYVETNENPNMKNNMNPINQNYITLRTKVNLQDTHRVIFYTPGEY